LLEVNGTELFIRRMGAGEPIIVVHGGPVLEHGYFLPHFARLARDFELIFFDQRLSGRSAGSVDSASVRIDTFVEDIEALRAQLDVDQFHLMAHSWGGLLAMRYALAHEDRLRSLVLVSPMSASAALWQKEEEALAAQITAEDRAAREEIMASEGFRDRRPDAIRQLLLLSFRTQFHDPDKLQHLSLYVPEDYVERSRQFGFLAPELTAFDFHEDLHALSVPTLLVYGASEPGAEIGGKRLNESIEGSELRTLDAAGHFPFVEQPEAFFRVVAGFLRASDR
jgi:proline iminopeptidase